MAPVTCSNVNALEHIFTVLLGEAIPASTNLTPFPACFTTAGMTNASNFVTMDPSANGADGSILFPLTTKDGIADQQLNVIQVKKLGSLFSWLAPNLLLASPPGSTSILLVFKAIVSNSFLLLQLLPFL
jgi:hypothetical protein